MAGETGQHADDEVIGGLLRLLDLERLELDLFRGYNPDQWPGGRIFGGLVAAQAVRAAMGTVGDEHHVHSFHSYFLRPGRQGTPIVYAVDRIRDGRSFTTRHVNGIQNGEVVFALTASFHRDEDTGVDYQLPLAQDAPPPEAAPPDAMFGGRSPAFFAPFEMRDVGPTPPEPDGTYRSTRRQWIRLRRRLPDDRDLHATVLTFMSDMAVVAAVQPPTGQAAWEGMMAASLDHALWFHRPARVDEWLFYDLHSVSSHGARGLARGTYHTAGGVLVASITQEALMRPLPPGAPPMIPPSEPPPEL